MLDERKRRILQAVVDDYISSAEPVGSRTVARRHDLGFLHRRDIVSMWMICFLLHRSTNARER